MINLIFHSSVSQIFVDRAQRSNIDRWLLDSSKRVNYNDLTATSLESWLERGIIPKWL